MERRSSLLQQPPGHTGIMYSPRTEACPMPNSVKATQTHLVNEDPRGFDTIVKCLWSCFATSNLISIQSTIYFKCTKNCSYENVGSLTIPLKVTLMWENSQ